MNLIKVGDTVVAVCEIWRKDGRSGMKPGERAKVIRVFQRNPDAPQIIDVVIPGKLRMIDIVCVANDPFTILQEDKS